MKFIFSNLRRLGSVVKKVIGKSQSKLVDPQSKKIASPSKVKKMAGIVLASFTLTIILVTVLTDNTFVGNGMGDFQKQKGVRFGVTRVNTDNSVNAIDPLENFNANELSMEEQCNALHERVKNSENLSDTEYEVFKKCLRNNTIIGLTDQQKKALNALANPNSNLSPAAKALLGKVADGSIDPDSEEGKIAAALMSNDPLARQVAEKLLDPNLSDAERQMLVGYLDGKVSPDVAKGLLNQDAGVRTKALALNDAIKSGKHVEAEKLRNAITEASPQVRQSVEDNGAAQNEAEAMKVALDDMSDELSKLKQALSGFSLQIPKIESKVSNNQPLTAGEQAVYKDYNDTKTKTELLETAKQQAHADYQRLLSKVPANVGNAYADYNSENREIIDEYDPRANFKPEPVVKKTEVVKKVSRITATEYELIKSIRAARMSDDYEGSLYPNTNPTTFNQKEMVASAASSGRMSPLKNYNLPLDLRIPCVVETEIFVSSNDSSGRRVLCTVLDNIYNPENNDILIPKGSKAIGVTAAFDANTKLMQVSFSKVRVGKENYDIGFSLIDATGRQGIQGGVIRTRNKRITAAVLTDFAAGVTQFFSQYAQQRMLQNGVNNLSLANSVVGASFQGVSTGLTKIAETLTQDLQNSPDIFYSPAGMKMILIPN